MSVLPSGVTASARASARPPIAAPAVLVATAIGVTPVVVAT